MQKTKPGRARARLAKECQDFCKWVVYVSELETGSMCQVSGLSNVDEIVSGLSEVDRGFMLCESSFVHAQKLQEG